MFAAMSGELEDLVSIVMSPLIYVYISPSQKFAFPL
jgi:hypothetical protein